MSDRRPWRSRHRIGLIGGGIDGSLSPQLHEQEAHVLGIDYRYERLDINTYGLPPEQAGELLRRALADGYTGFNITHPCKQILTAECDELSADALALGAVNTIVVTGGRLIGYNTDHTGFIEGLRTGLPDARRARVAVVGAGGAGSAVAYGLLSAGTQSVSVLDTDYERVKHLGERLEATFPESVISTDRMGAFGDVVQRVDGVVNATPVGMDGYAGVPFDPSLVHARQWVADVVYHPLETQLLAGVRAAGCATLDGGLMLVAQAAETMALVSGSMPDLPRMRAHLVELLCQGSSSSAG